MDLLTQRRLAYYAAQLRDKYDTAQLEALLKKGEAFKNENGEPSFPIADEDDLENAIRAVGRAGSDHDEVRKYIIGRAKALGLEDKIPDTWNADGSLEDKKAAAWDYEHRGELSYGELNDLLSAAVCEKYVKHDQDAWDCWVLDFTDSTVVWCLAGETFQSDYSISGNDVTLSNKTQVQRVTTYVPLESKSAKRDKPTTEDPGIAALIASAHVAVAKAVAAQLQDPDNTTDPDDADVMADLKAAQKALDKALAAQSKDGHKDRSAFLGTETRDGYQPVAYHRQPGENILCPHCDRYNHADAKYCDQCGFQLEGETVDGQQNYQPAQYARSTNEDVWCPMCAKCNFDDACYCDQCGTTLVGSDSVTIGDTEGLAGATDAPAPRSSIPAIPKRAFTSFMERPPAHKALIEMRAGPTDSETSAGFVGYASTTGQGYSVADWMGEYRETIAPGAFAKTLREQPNVPLLFNHDGWPLASTGSDTSWLSEDKGGLRNEAVLDLLQPSGMEAYRCLKRGTLNKMSFSFRAIKDTWNDAYDDRSVDELALFDTSVVTYPANPNTTAELRDAIQMALGREGRSLFWSTRSALQTVQQRHVLPVDAEPVVDKALRALFAADEEMTRLFGPQGRARTYVVARSLYELRVGKVLSSGNATLLKQALDALGDASSAVTQVLANNETDPAENNGSDNGDTNDEGMDYSGDAGGPGSPGGINPLMPQDGLGPRIGNTGPRSDRTPESVKRALAKIAAARSVQ